MKRRHFIAGIGLLGIMGPGAALQRVHRELPEEGVEFDYKVFYGGNHIGNQRVAVRRHTQDGHVVIDHFVKLEVRVLFALAYSLEHESTEVWDVNRQLKSVKSKTIENGDTSLVAGRLEPEGFVVSGTDGETRAPRSLVTSDSFWLAAAMESPVVMNTRTGDVATPQIADLGGGRYHLKAEFVHGLVEGTLHFEGEFLRDAEIDSEGHVVRFQRV